MKKSGDDDNRRKIGGNGGMTGEVKSGTKGRHIRIGSFITQKNLVVSLVQGLDEFCTFTRTK